MKLNLLPPAPKPPISHTAEGPWAGGRMRWWKVTTEGDEEGRTTKQLGQHYGHVAEIAFALADRCFYTLQFSPCEPPGYLASDDRPQRRATRGRVWISLDIKSRTWDMSHEHRAEWMRAWLDLDADSGIEILARTPNAMYHAGTVLQFKGHKD